MAFRGPGNPERTNERNAAVRVINNSSGSVDVRGRILPKGKPDEKRDEHSVAVA